MQGICPKCKCNIKEELKEREGRELKKRLQLIELDRLKAIKKLVKKHGMKGLLIIVGDNAVKLTKSKEDDKVCDKVKKVLNKV